MRLLMLSNQFHQLRYTYVCFSRVVIASVQARFDSVDLPSAHKSFGYCLVAKMRDRDPLIFSPRNFSPRRFLTSCAQAHQVRNTVEISNFEVPTGRIETRQAEAKSGVLPPKHLRTLAPRPAKTRLGKSLARSFTYTHRALSSSRVDVFF